jgi:hypothetical protein
VIWYRHWLELRRPVALLIAFAIIAGYFFARSLNREVSGLQARNDTLRPGIARGFGPLLASLTPTQTVAVAVHAESTIFLVLLAFLVLGGNGLRIVEMQSASGWTGAPTLPARAATYTLSLPLSRPVLVVTRVGAAYAAGVIFFAVSCLIHRLVIVSAGYDVPLLPMIMISLFATVVTIFWSTVLSMLTWILGATFALFLTLIVALFSSMFVYRGMGDIAAGQRAMWQIVPLMLVTIAGVVYVTTRLVADEEF